MPIFDAKQYLWYANRAQVSPPNLGGPELVEQIPFRPLGKSVFKRCPWSYEDDDEYCPTKMSEEAMRIGLSKSNRVVPKLDENLCQKTDRIMEIEMASIWTETVDENVLSYDKALGLIKRDKSPGYPFFYRYLNKGETLDQEGDLIKQDVDRLLNGEEVPCVFSLTEKSELRPIEKVRLNKTRVFMASPLHHLLACLMLFQVQNDAIINSIGSHPITIGMQIPGAQFVRFVGAFGNDTNDGDVDGCDLGFHPRVADFIRRLRSKFLPQRYWKCVAWLYSTVYAGLAAGLGGIYRIYGNKSGWCNTAHDNSLMVWWYIIYGCCKFYPNLHWTEVIKALINGDDVLIKYKGNFKEFCDFLAKHGCIIDCENWEKRHCSECVFLSHHVESRWVTGFGDFVLAAGNLPKLKSSINWVKSSKILSFEESCVAHLVGLRICMFPWKIEFDRVDQILSDYLKEIIITPFISSCLSARFNEVELAYLNTRCEANPDVSVPFSHFVSASLCDYKQVLKCVTSLFKRSYDTNSLSKA